MARLRTSRFLTVVFIILASIVAIVALVSFARVIFFSGGNTVQVDQSREALLSTTADRKVQLTVRGPIVADENFHSYTIAITPSSRHLTTHSGYLDSVVDRVALSNNVTAYEQFVYALDKAQMWRGTQLDGEGSDVRGVCATGKVFEFSIIKENKEVKRLWTSTCNNARGTLIARHDPIVTLFQNQIPDAKTLIRKVKL